MDYTLHLEAGADAFGNGEHPSTQLVVGAMQQLASEGLQFTNILDMGCGSGVLALIAARLWPQAAILAVDIEPKAVAATAENARANGIKGHIRTIRSDGYRHSMITENAPYDLVLANMTAGPLISMAADLGRVLAPTGVALLSGILAWRLDELIQTHLHCGLALEADPVEMEGGWCAVALGKAE